MRRAKVQLPWISMMDLLFGLFGGLIILAMIITLKLGQNAGIDSRPYTLITVSATSADSGVQAVLERMHLAFDVRSKVSGSEPKCLFSAASENVNCLDFQRDMGGAPVRFSTQGKDRLSASLFVGSVDNKLPATIVRPALRDVAQFLDSPDYDTLIEQYVQIRLSVKFGEAYFEPDFDLITVGDLVKLAYDSKHDGKDISIVPKGTFECSIAAPDSESTKACERLEVSSDGFYFE